MTNTAHVYFYLLQADAEPNLTTIIGEHSRESASLQGHAWRVTTVDERRRTLLTLGMVQQRVCIPIFASLCWYSAREQQSESTVCFTTIAFLST